MASSSMSSIARALSPSIGAITAAFESSPESASSARHFALQAANSVEEVIAMIPSDYRDVLRAPLFGVSSTVVKLYNARATVARWLQHQAAGTIPAHMRAAAPEVQLTKGFLEGEGAAHKAALAKGHQEYLSAVLAASLAAKQDDIKFLDASLEPKRLYEELAPLLDARRKEVVDKSLMPIFADGAELGELVFESWAPNTSAIELAKQVKRDSVIYAYRVIALTTAREQAGHAKVEKKRELAKSADVEMADATKPGPSIQSLIDKAVSARLKKAPQASSSSKSGGQVSFRFSPYSSTSSDSSSSTGFKRAQEEVVGDSAVQTRRRQTSGDSVYSTPGPQGPVCNCRREGQETREETERFSWGQEREGEGRRINSSTTAFCFLCFVNRIDVPPSWYLNFHLIPDALLSVPYDMAVNKLILNTPLNILEANSYKSLIHRGPNVVIPREIELDLSVGFRYMFKSARNTKLIKDAWKDFEERLRWRIYFMFDKSPETLDSYDPDYEVPHIRKGKPPRLPQYIEAGIMEGRHFVNSNIAKIPHEETGRINNPLVPSRSQIEQFLISNRYVCTMTDKNLGIAVSERTWLDEKCVQLLNDPVNYTPIHEIQFNSICNHQCTAMENLALLAESINNFPEGQQLGNFFRKSITPEGQKHVAPVFYGIPKIHKEPVKARPIIPCHSAIQNPAAKYISKKLKPLVEAAPTILKGSKDLAIKLSKVTIDRKRSWYIVTGDVVAFYPHIPLELCINIMCTLYEEYRGQPITEAELKEMKLFIQALHVGNRNLVTQYNNQYYLQKEGLAMGVSDSPDLANLYGWWFERLSQVVNHPLIPFYGRFIDDVVSIIYADSEAEAINIMSNLIKFDGCEIEWNASDYSAPFLDMTIYKDSDGSIQHMPFRKARSHQERIPWISHHPLDVKRGTFIGEMSRLAVLSSKHSHYLESIRGLCTLYIARGYPLDLIKNWTRLNITVRWSNRLVNREPKEQLGNLLVLKSSFNTAWNYFNAHELGDTVIGYWRSWLAAAESENFSTRYPKYSGAVGELVDTPTARCVVVKTIEGPLPMPDIRTIGLDKSKLIVSRKRTRNMLDLTNLWKKTVFEKLESDAADAAVEPDEDVEMDDISSDDSETDPAYLFSTIGYR